jgi:integrase
VRAHKMKDGRWAMWLDLGIDMASGRRIRKRVEAKTKREAESKATALRERHQRGEDVRRKPRMMGMLFDDWLDTITIEGRAPNTLRAYRGVLTNHLRPRLSAASVPTVHMIELQRMFNEMASQLAPAYIKMIRTVLCQAFDFAIVQGERTDNPARAISIPKLSGTPGRSLTPNEVRAVRSALEGNRYGLAIQLALLGLRRSEIPALRWEDFDAQAGTLLVRRQLLRDTAARTWRIIDHTKGGGMRMLSLGPKLTAALQLLRRSQAVEREAMVWPDSGYIFVSVRNGGPCPPGTIYKAFKAVCTAAGIAPARLHDCRHTAGTMLLAGGEDIGTVAGVLGHANPQVTATVYAHALPHRVADASKRLEAIYDDTDEMRRRHVQ